MLTRPDAGTLTVFFDGRPLRARPGDSIAAVLLAHDIRATRATTVSGQPRGPYCMMGACFDCLAVVDGAPNVQTCLMPVRQGMRIERQHGARDLGLTTTDPA